MGYEWDDRKNIANLEKHKIRFEEAIEAFRGPMLTGVDRRRDYGETREISIGKIEDLVIVIIHTKRHFNIRIISARKASARERKEYHEYLEKTTR